MTLGANQRGGACLVSSDVRTCVASGESKVETMCEVINKVTIKVVDKECQQELCAYRCDYDR